MFVYGCIGTNYIHEDINIVHVYYVYVDTDLSYMYFLIYYIFCNVYVYKHIYMGYIFNSVHLHLQYNIFA